MSAYKEAKEAFVSDNVGDAILKISLTSLTSLSSYLLYAVLRYKYRRSPFVNFLVLVIPPLLSVTLLQPYPLAFNISLIVISWFLQSRPRNLRHQNGHAHPSAAPGKWLDESDSEEESSATIVPDNLSPNSKLSLPSEVFRNSGESSRSSLSPLSPTLSSVSDDNNETARSTFKRRHTPTPSTHTHTAIDILPTPQPDFVQTTTHEYRNWPSSRLRELERDAANAHMPFVSVYRAYMMVMTVICILAVDFKVFPRIQGKCENFGTSLMDVGVGSFVFSLGLVSVKSLEATEHNSKNLIRDLRRTTWKSLPIIALGVIRVIMVKGSDYPEHVTEYGVHWNFFFTLALLPICGLLFKVLRARDISWTIIAIVIAAAHEVALSRFGLRAWVLSSARHGLIGMNKEGIVSLPGYLAIYTLGLSTGRHVLRAATLAKRVESVTESAEERIKRHYAKRRSELAMELFGYAVGWWLALLLTSGLCGPVSRRLANLRYVLWVAAYNTTFLLGYLVIEVYLFDIPAPKHAVPPLFDAINRNGLVVFLAANLLTGLVNVSFETMYVSDLMGITVLVGYTAGVSIIAWILRPYRLKL